MRYLTKSVFVATPSRRLRSARGITFALLGVTPAPMWAQSAPTAPTTDSTKISHQMQTGVQEMTLRYLAQSSSFLHDWEFLTQAENSESTPENVSGEQMQRPLPLAWNYQTLTAPAANSSSTNASSAPLTFAAPQFLSRKVSATPTPVAFAQATFKASIARTLPQLSGPQTARTASVIAAPLNVVRNGSTASPVTTRAAHLNSSRRIATAQHLVAPEATARPILLATRELSAPMLQPTPSVAATTPTRTATLPIEPMKSISTPEIAATTAPTLAIEKPVVAEKPQPSAKTVTPAAPKTGKSQDDRILLAQLDAELGRAQRHLDSARADLDEGARDLGSFTNTLQSAMLDAGPDAKGLHPFVRTAQRYAGTPYVWGGESARGFDCSGFIIRVMRDLGYRALPHSAAEQFNYGTPVAKALLKPGDLVFFANTYKPGISHVGIYLGRGRFIHAAGTGKGTIVSHLSASPYAEKYAGARRLIAKG